MERKLYLNRGGAGQEKSSYVKVLLWAAVGLVVLMLIATRLTGIKGTKNGLGKSGQDKGAVVREIPRSTPGLTESSQQIPPLVAESKESAEMKVAPLPGMQPLPDSQGRLPAEKQAEGLLGAPGIEPAKPLPVEKTPPIAMTPSDTAASQAFKALDGALPPSGKTPTQAAAKHGATGAAIPVATGATPAKAKEKTASLSAPKSPDEAKPKSVGGELYAVQVGSYHDKKNADELQQSLKKKGYAVSVKTKADPKGGGPLYVVHLEPVSDMGKAHTLVAQVQHEEKVKPFIMKIQPGE
ncbi:MAG: SPOR domain-containing protein [Syntrophobacteraceae bacterium]